MSTLCTACNKHTTAKPLPCGHAWHTACGGSRGRCITCHPKNTLQKVHKSSFITKCAQPNTTKRITTSVNGNLFITVNQRDDYGRTYSVREIRADKAQEFAKVCNDQPYSDQSYSDQSYSPPMTTPVTKPLLKAPPPPLTKPLLKAPPPTMAVTARNNALPPTMAIAARNNAPVANGNGNLGVLFMKMLGNL